MAIEYLNSKINKAIDKFVVKKKIENQLSNEKWLDIMDRKREGRKKFVEGFLRTRQINEDDEPTS